jgi:hypothetical protein
MLLQLLGVSHMKLGAEMEFRSLIKTQSLAEQLFGFARTSLEHRALLEAMSLKKTNGLCSGV